MFVQHCDDCSHCKQEKLFESQNGTWQEEAKADRRVYCFFLYKVPNDSRQGLKSCIFRVQQIYFITNNHLITVANHLLFLCYGSEEISQ